MASSLALKRTTASAVLNRVLNPIRSSSVLLPSVSRSYNTNTQMTRLDDDERSLDDVDRRGRGGRAVGRRGVDSVPSFFSDVFDPFSPTRSLSQLMNMMDQIMDSPYQIGFRGLGGGGRRGWDVREDEEGLHLRVDMPGLGKEDVKISVEQNTLVIRGEGGKEAEEEEEHGRRYSSRVDLPPELYKVDEIKAEMKNGVLKVVVPKVKEVERKDVRQVNVE